MKRRARVDLYLHPGELTVQARPLGIKTILGSCVAVCLWDPQTRVGGLNHYLLPHPARDERADNRFGSVATPALLAAMQRAGANLARVVAWVVGGGHPINVLSDIPIGAGNTALALEILQAHGIRVERQETGGAFGRKLLFDTGTGAVTVRRLGQTAPVAARESHA